MFSSFLALLERYPAAWSFVGPLLLAFVWGLVSGVFNTVYDRFSPHSDPEWAAFFVKHPRWGAVVSVFKTAGLNLPGLFRSLRVFFGGSLPTPIAVAFSGSKPPTSLEARALAIEAAKQILREENAALIEKYAAPLVGVVAVPPGPDLGVSTGGPLPPRPTDRVLPEAAPTPKESSR